jgi:uncharacterized protein DUF3810
VFVPAPESAASVDRYYSRGVYGLFQPLLTSVSSLLPVAWLDLLLLGALIGLVLRCRGVARAVGPARRQALVALAADVVTAIAALYIVFLLAWGLNYRRLPITATLDFDRKRVTREAVERLGVRAVDQLNRLYARAHADPSAIATLAAVRVHLAPAFTKAQRDLGATHIATPGQPKRSLLSLYFRWATVDGMVNPYGLEVLVNPDLVPIERPFVVAHEWGHLAGWARESEASLVGWTTCMEGDETAQYSGWMSLLMHVRGEVSRDVLARIDAALASGPRGDLAAIYGRLATGQPAIQRASWRAYDQFLKANRVPEGVRSYDEVITLILGTRLRADTPRSPDVPRDR